MKLYRAHYLIVKIKHHPSILVVINEDQFFCTNFLSLFKAILKEGYTIYVASADSGYRARIEQEGFIFVDIPIKRRIGGPIDNLRLLFRLHQLYRRLKPDIIHHITLKIILTGTFASIFTKESRIINHFPGLGYVMTLPQKHLLRVLVSVLLRLAFSMKKTILLFENKDDRIDITRITNVPLQNTMLIKGAGIDLGQFYYSPPHDHPLLTILFPSRIIQTKGVMEFITAASFCRSTLKDQVHFILAGRIDPYNPGHITAAGLMEKMEPGYLEWIGFSEDIQQLMQESDIIVLPSYREGLPKALMEACATGRPIITTDVPGCRECVRDGYNGFLVPVKSPEAIADKIRLLVVNASLREEMGRNSRRLAEQEFSLDKVKEELLKAYTRS